MILKILVEDRVRLTDTSATDIRGFAGKEVLMRGDQPTVAGRGLGAELRSIREECKLSTRKAAERLDWPQSKVSKIETGKQRAKPADVASLLAIYGVTGHQRDQLVTKAERAEEPGLIETQTGLSRESRTLMELDSQAARLFNYEPLLVPGLLQTPDYTRAVMTAARGFEPDIDARVAHRLARQAILSRYTPPDVEFVIDEGVLHRSILPSRLMARQLRHIIETTERHNVDMCVLPLSLGAHSGLDGSFTIIDLSAPKSVVYLDHKFTGTFLEEGYEIDLYRSEAARLKEIALSSEASADLVATIAKTLEQQ